MRARLLAVMLIIGIMATPALPRAHAAAGTYFDNIVIVAMENQNYVDVMGSGTGSSNAPFIASLLPYGTTFPNFHAYGASGRNTCATTHSAGCYEALIAGVSDLLGNGYSCCIPDPTLVGNRFPSAGLTWQAYCESGCPRGNDHFPFTGFSDTSSCSCIFAGSSVSTSNFVAAANSANPPSFLWFTPTDNHNMHDNSIQTGDAYLHDFFVGSTGSIASPASGSLLASSLFMPGHRTLLLVWWDEYDPAPILFYAPGIVKQAYISSSDIYDEFSILHTIENNWALTTLTPNDAVAAPMTEIFGSSTPLPLATSFTVSPSTPIVNLPVTFTATTTGGKSPYTISWNFGDGSTGTGASILHAFLNAQSFTITETATDSSSPSQTATSSRTLTVSTPPPPSTSFTYLPSSPIINSPVTFTATTTGGAAPYSVSWNFGDGGSGTGALTIHTFTSAQSFTVSETATDSSSPSQRATSSATVTVLTIPPLSTSFTFLPTSPLINTPVSFTSVTTGGTLPYTVIWNFGDRATGAGTTAAHTYTTGGTFSVVLTVSDSGSPVQSVVVSKSITVSPVSPGTVTLKFEGFDFDGQNEVTLTLNGVIIASYWSVANPANGQTWVPLSLTIVVVQGANTLVFTHANSDCAVNDNIRNLQVINGTQVLFSNLTVHTLNCTTPATYNFNIGRVPLIPPTLTVPGNQTVTAGTWINFTITAASVNIGGTISLSATALPTGASFYPTTGLFSWKPGSSQVGSYTIVFTATDSSYPSTPTNEPMGIQVSQAAPGGSGGGNGGSGGSSSGGCLFCGVIPKISTNLGLLMIGGLLGLVASLALLTIKARASLEQTKRRMNRLTRDE
ncbi:MAG TPA: PKD domain-containing protein [Candidatus Bathyarchaeia archaeon]|nr:PKD domain-containing protein [Candidatus Bathyarchaeia archaeon]